MLVIPELFYGIGKIILVWFTFAISLRIILLMIPSEFHKKI